MSVEAKDVRTLMKILIGAAWLDGKIQPEEREYLHRIVREQELENDPELSPLLYEFRPVKSEECYAWVRQYLGDRPTAEDYQQLMEAISGLVYSDGTIANEEAKLLTELQVLENEKGGGLEDSAIVKAIRGLYQRWVSQLEA